MSDTLRVGIIGLGRIGYSFEKDKLMVKPASHWGAFSNCDATEVTAVCDTNREVREDAIDDFPSGIYKTVKEMLDTEDLDIIVIATPDKTHYPIFREIIDSWEGLEGRKGIVVEKPMTLDLAQARDMINMTNGRNIVLAVNHTRRWDFNYQHIFDFIDTDKMGKMLSITGNYTGTPLNNGIHMVDLFNWFKEAQSWDKENTLVRVTNYPTTYTLFDFDIVLEHGRVRCFDNGRDIHIYIEDISTHYAKALELKEVSFTKSDIPPMLTMAYDTSACVLKEGKVPRCSGQNGYESLRDILRVVK